jgi:hypothetical protein
MRIPLLLAASLAMPAGVIQGVVLEWASGKPLSRTIVNLQPVPGSGANLRPVQIRSGRSGQFSFPNIPDGLYLLQTQREGFLPAAFGQRRPTGHGHPITVTRDSALFTELRLHRMGAITGAVLDENGIGLPRVNVVAYSARLPLRIAGRGVSDDRGVYRIAGLPLGKYWVRTAAHLHEDGTGFLPFFGPESAEPRDAILHEVRFDHDTPDADIRPRPGALFSLAGAITCQGRTASPVTVTLSSEFSRQTVESSCGGAFQFAGLAPANYEILAVYPDGGGYGFVERHLSQPTQLAVQVVSTPPVSIDVRHVSSRAAINLPLRLYGRREDLAGPDSPREIPLRSADLPAGYWLLAATPPDGYYVAAIATAGGTGRSARRNRPADWFPLYLQPQFGEFIRVQLSDRPGQIAGRTAAPGVPVFLWPVNDETRHRLGGPRETLSDAAGAFRFTGLPPGDYRVLPTREFREISAEAAEEARAVTLTLAEGQSRDAGELPLWIAP